MAISVVPAPPDAADPSSPNRPPAGPPASARPLWLRLVRGRSGDPAWGRPALVALLALTGVLYLWDLSGSGYGNTFYAAAVQAGSKSWKAMFFGSSDAANFITVDKPPASLWVMEVSARSFGFNSWSLLVPQAIEGVATVAVLYAAVRRWFSSGTALLAGLAVALTPVAALMFRFNNPDALLVLLLTAAAYATVRALEAGRTRWLVLAGALVGFGFLAKELQALVVVPALALAYLIAGPPRLGRRVGQLLLSGLALVIAGGWWVLAVQLTPAADRPYIGGSQNNSLWNVIFGYNGFGRLTGNETGSVGGGGGRGGTAMWGPTGITRLFQADMGGQISWLILAALLGLAAGLWWTRRAARTDRTRAALVLFGSALLVTGLVISFGQGIIHPYYTVALAPLIAATVAIATAMAWARRHTLTARFVVAAGVVASAIWAAILLDRTPSWHPWLRVAVVVAALVAAAGLLAWPSVTGRAARLGVGVLALVAVLGGPVGYTLNTVSQPHTGAIPSAGPALSGAFGGRPGGGPGLGGPGGGFGAGGFALNRGGPAGAGGGGLPAGGPGAPGAPGVGGGNVAGGGRGVFGGRATGGGGVGGLLNGASVSKAAATALKAGGGHYRWLIATVGSENASSFQLATGDPVMSIGGFNGTDPAPTLTQFEAYVKAGKIHYFVAGGGGAGPAAGGATSSTSSAITSWVESHFAEKTVGGISVYDLTSPTSAAGT
jgi:4-amino-4-deoxy-L-arabinose transferase-like glycosyltransferase